MKKRIMKKRPGSEGRSCDGRSNCNGESGAKEPQRDIGKSAREWHFDLEGKDNRFGHASVQTTKRYLGCKQKLSHAVNDNLGLEDT
jgi:hypothetical protein